MVQNIWQSKAVRTKKFCCGITRVAKFQKRNKSHICGNNTTKKGLIFLQYLWAFLVGGAFCVIGQLLIDFTKLTPARILVGFVVAGVIISAIGWYQPLVDFAGAGATVPLTGFGHTLATGVKEAIAKDGIIGIFTGGLTATAGGISAAIVFSVIASLIFNPKSHS